MLIQNFWHSSRWKCIALFWLITLIAGSIAEDTQPFSQQPSIQPYYVRENEQGPKLECSLLEDYKERERYELEWVKVQGGLPTTISRDGMLFHKAYYILEDDVAKSGSYNLVIKSIKFDRDNAQFYCVWLDKVNYEQVRSIPAQVMVLVPPSPPKITNQPYQPVKENDIVEVTCESSGGNPKPTFTWTFDNKTVVPPTWIKDRSENLPRGNSVSEVSWRVSPMNNNAYLTCQIWNEALNQGESLSTNSNRLNVLYAPRVAVGPIAEYNAEEGERVELNCSADANPPANQFEFLHVQTGDHTGGPTWIFMAEKKYQGEFRCTAHNQIDMSSKQLTLNVLYGPQIRVKEVVNPAEGDQLVLECDVDANPKPDSIVWTGPNGIKHIGNRLIIESINRAHTGNFTCTASNTLYTYSSGPSGIIRTNSASTFVDVKRRPGAAIITASRSSVNVDDSITLSCMADDPGSPEAKFKWATPSSHGVYGTNSEVNRQSITISSAQLSDNGHYRCVAYNEIGQGEEATVKILVIDPAKISRPLLPTMFVSSGEHDKSLECEGVGYPVPEIRWLKDGMPISEAKSSHWVISTHPQKNPSSCEHGEYCGKKVVSQLQFFEKVEWNDKGNYTCIADNGAIASIEKSEMVLNVVHAPVVLNEKYPDEALAAADIGKTARIVCSVSARPEPKFIWSRDGIELTEDPAHHQIQSARLVEKIDEYESVLEIGQVEQSDLGIYVCKALNGQAGDDPKLSEVAIKLTTKSKPYMPRAAKLIDATPTSILVGWRPSFDGGEPQIFEVEYRMINPWTGKADSMEPTRFTLAPYNLTSMVVYDTDTTVARRSPRSLTPRRRVPRSLIATNYYVHNLTSLLPMSTYWYRVRANNSLGTSDWSPIAPASTLDVSETVDLQPPTSLSYIPDERRIVFELHRPSSTYCLLLYINVKESSEPSMANSWRALGCYPSDQPILEIEPAEHFKARFCVRDDLTTCSSSTEIFVNTTAMAEKWKLAIIIPLAIFLLVAILCLSLTILCCKLRHSPKKEKKKAKKFATIASNDRTDGGAQLPQADNKNTVVHGSQADSGVFTLGSNQPNGGQNVGFEGSNEAASGDSWRNSSDEHYDYNNDPYLQECNGTGQYMWKPDGADGFALPPPTLGDSYGEFFEGFVAQQKSARSYHVPEPPLAVISSGDEQDSSDSASISVNGSRRVMREIIV